MTRILAVKADVSEEYPTFAEELVTTHWIPLFDGRSAQIRLGELICRDGLLCYHIDSARPDTSPRLAFGSPRRSLRNDGSRMIHWAGILP